MNSNRFFLNIDINSVNFPYLNAMIRKENLTEEDLYPFVDQYVGTQITDLLFDVFCQISMTPTAVMTSAVEMYRKETVDGQKVDFTTAWTLLVIVRIRANNSLASKGFVR